MKQLISAIKNEGKILSENTLEDLKLKSDIIKKERKLKD